MYLCSWRLPAYHYYRSCPLYRIPKKPRLGKDPGTGTTSSDHRILDVSSFTFYRTPLAHMPTPNHTPRGSRTTLPPRLTVPPFPPQLYRQLLLTVEKDGVLIRPQHPTGGDDEDDVRTDGTTGVLIKWGAKGKVETWDGEGKPDDEQGVVLGGLLGIVRLWDGTSHTRRSMLIL